MTANQTRESAQIFQFPVGGRAGMKRDLTNVQAPRIDIAVGGSWYHEEAIRDDKPIRTN